MRGQLKRRLGALMLGLLGAVGCGDSSGPGTARLSLVLKDAPGDIKAAVVTISEINLQGSGGTITLRDVPITTNLLTLSADAALLVQGFVIPAGTYTQLRFVISGAYLEVDNGDGTSSFYASSPTYAGLPPNTTLAGTLQMPSFGQSGLKVILPGNALIIGDGGDELMVLDFDVSESFGHQAGNSGQWVMHPVIKATRASATGSAQVTLALDAGVTLPIGVTLGNFTATIIGSDAVGRTASFADIDADGTFDADFLFLTPDDYTVTITAPSSITAFTTTPPLPGALTVPAGGSGTAAFVLTGAEASPGS